MIAFDANLDGVEKAVRMIVDLEAQLKLKQTYIKGIELELSKSQVQLAASRAECDDLSERLVVFRVDCACLRRDMAAAVVAERERCCAVIRNECIPWDFDRNALRRGLVAAIREADAEKEVDG